MRGQLHRGRAARHRAQDLQRIGKARPAVGIRYPTSDRSQTRERAPRRRPREHDHHAVAIAKIDARVSGRKRGAAQRARLAARILAVEREPGVGAGRVDVAFGPSGAVGVLLPKAVERDPARSKQPILEARVRQTGAHAWRPHLQRGDALGAQRAAARAPRRKLVPQRRRARRHPVRGERLPEQHAARLHPAPGLQLVRDLPHEQRQTPGSGADRSARLAAGLTVLDLDLIDSLDRHIRFDVLRRAREDLRQLACNPGRQRGLERGPRRPAHQLIQCRPPTRQRAFGLLVADPAPAPPVGIELQRLVVEPLQLSPQPGVRSAALRESHRRRHNGGDQGGRDQTKRRPKKLCRLSAAKTARHIAHIGWTLES